MYVRGIEFEASHGHTAAERRATRRFRCDLELQLDLSVPARSDRLADTIDYGLLSGMVVDIGTSQTFKLLEALAGAIADAILARYPQVVLTVSVEKLAPPCPGVPSLSGVRLVRGQ